MASARPSAVWSTSGTWRQNATGGRSTARRDTAFSTRSRFVMARSYSLRWGPRHDPQPPALVPPVETRGDLHQQRRGHDRQAEDDPADRAQPGAAQQVYAQEQQRADADHLSGEQAARVARRIAK